MRVYRPSFEWKVENPLMHPAIGDKKRTICSNVNCKIHRDEGIVGGEVMEDSFPPQPHQIGLIYV